MNNVQRYGLIVTAVAIVIFSVGLSVFLYFQNRKIQGSFTDLKIAFESLQKENSAIGQQLKDKNTLLEQATQEKADLNKKISAVNEDLSALKAENAKLQESLREKEGVILSLEKEKKEIDSENNMQKIDMETEAIIQKTGLDKLKPKDFSGDFNGDEQFLQGCSTPLCKKIILNSAGIKYAKSGQWDKAENAFKEALSNDPNYKPAKLNLGLVYDKIKPKREAVDYWLEVYNIKL